MILKPDDRNTTEIKVVYDVTMALLAILIIVSLFLQGRSDLSEEQLTLIKHIDFAVWIIFVADYIIRFILAKDKLSFFKGNIIDLVSILPFDIAFQGLRAMRIIRVFYMFRVFVYLNRLYKRLGNIITMNNFHHVLWFTFATIFGGAIAISFIEDMTIGDALWWSFVTTTTVGYGDIAPASLGGRIVAVCLMVIGIGFLSTLTGTISSYFISLHSTPNRYKNDAVNEIISRLEDFKSLNVEDLDNIHAVLVALKNKEE